MRTWLQIFQIIADMQPGDINKLDKEEGDIVRQVVDSVAEGTTMVLDSEDFELLNRAMDKLAPTTH